MRIKRLASLAFYLSLTSFLACSQSGSPFAVTDEDSETGSADQRGSSESETASTASDSEKPSTEDPSISDFPPTGTDAGGTEPAFQDSSVDEGTSGTDEPDSTSAGDASDTAISVVDSVLAGMNPAQPAASGAQATESGPSDPHTASDPSETDSASADTASETSPEQVVAPESETAVAEPAGEASSAAKISTGVAVEPAASEVSSAPSASKVFLATDFEGEDLSCWNGNRAANGVNRAGCGPYTSIGSVPFALTEGGIARSGRKALAITYAKNEEAGGANVSLNSDSVNVRAYYYFEPGFDFGQGLKIGRVSSFNTAKQINDVDIILEVRSAKSSNQCGVTDMRDVGMFFNGAPKGSDWGNATSTMAFERGKWYAVEYQVVLNAPGKTDGAVRLWVDGKLVAERTGLPIRGTLGAEAKLNVVKIGGWYSNGANGNSCANPSQPAKLHMDDVAIASSYIGA